MHRAVAEQIAEQIAAFAEQIAAFGEHLHGDEAVAQDPGRTPH